MYMGLGYSLIWLLCSKFCIRLLRVDKVQIEFVYLPSFGFITDSIRRSPKHVHLAELNSNHLRPQQMGIKPYGSYQYRDRRQAQSLVQHIYVPVYVDFFSHLPFRYYCNCPSCTLEILLSGSYRAFINLTVLCLAAYGAERVFNQFLWLVLAQVSWAYRTKRCQVFWSYRIYFPELRLSPSLNRWRWAITVILLYSYGSSSPELGDWS